MRIHGNLKKWKDDRGFGFIAIPQQSSEIFVHISEFPKDGVRPTIGEPLSFEMKNDKNGKKRAIRIEREGTKAGSNTEGSALAWNNVYLKFGLGIIVIMALAYAGYRVVSNQPSSVPPSESMPNNKH